MGREDPIEFYTCFYNVRICLLHYMLPMYPSPLKFPGYLSYILRVK
jgi:hypothetical protein